MLVVKRRSLILFFLVAGALWGQDLSREAAIEAARAQKEQELMPPKDPKLQRIILRVESNPIYKTITGSDGFGIGFGNIVAGSGFAVGPQYTQTILDGHLHLNTYARGTAKEFYKTGIAGSLLDVWNGRASIDFDVYHADFPQMPYYGPGPDSQKTGRSDFRIERTMTEVRPAIRPVKHLLLGAIGNFQAINVGPGTSDKYISTDQQYGPAVVPGINRQTNYLQGGGFVQYDWRDEAGDTTSGGRYRAEYSRFSDRDAGAYSFYAVNLDAREYIPLFHRKRVIALHGQTWLTDTNGSQVVPFYMQPTLGGPDTMRGFRPFRFYDNNAVLIQGEYRWEASEVLDLALFADGGKVFHNWDQWNLHQIEGSFGFGLRFKGASGVALRIDTGFSHEGFQVWFRTGNPF
jgi:Omp85 superfamily domain